MNVQPAICELGMRHWAAVYRLMAERKFPDVPLQLEAAVPFFENASVYGLMDGTRLLAAFVFGRPDDGVAFFDVVCAPAMQGKWASVSVLRRLFALAFEELQLRCVWVQPQGEVALRAALAAGFVPATALDAASPVLVMTPGLLPRKFKTKTKEMNDGKPV
jgi:RimJ/RimL family protein N-acetyltransferase